MRLLPRLTAADSLGSVDIGGPVLPIKIIVWGNAKECNPTLAAVCGGDATEQFQNCQLAVKDLCAPACLAGGEAPSCRQCIVAGRAVCVEALNTAEGECASQYGCPASLGCTPDRHLPIGDPRGVCCEPGQIGCGGSCLPACEAPHFFYESECLCSCLPTVCPPGKPLNPDNCRCECPPCPDYRMGQDPETCACTCPAGTTDCNGYCADLASDPLFCGSCNSEPCDAFSELCCDGACTNICTDANCGGCGHAIQPGEKCCPPDCTPRRLGTNSDCSDCNDLCPPGRACIDGRCGCPPESSRDCCLNPPCANPCCPTDRACCFGVCCPSGHLCCDGACVDPNSDDAHCGSCNPCPADRTCFNGVCECASGTKQCGVQCIPAGQMCCQNIPCPPGTTDCCPGCMDLFTLSHPEQPGWLAWRAEYPTAKWGLCVDGTVTCNPTLVTLTSPAGGRFCCPPGSTGLDANGLCV